MGSQFIGQWWKTMYARLGSLQTYSPLHRPRANGRGEKVVSQLLSVLKKIHIEHNLNWVEASLRALWLHHDVTGEAGLSPNHICLGGIETPQAFYTHLRELVRTVSNFFNAWRILISIYLRS